MATMPRWETERTTIMTIWIVYRVHRRSRTKVGIPYLLISTRRGSQHRQVRRVRQSRRPRLLAARARPSQTLLYISRFLSPRLEDHSESQLVAQRLHSLPSLSPYSAKQIQRIIIMVSTGQGPPRDRWTTPWLDRTTLSHPALSASWN